MTNPVSIGLAGRFLWDLRTPMRDGVELSSDVYLPADGVAGGPYPLVLIRTPHSNQHPTHVEYARYLSDNGIAVAVQDVRGRHDSGGAFHPFQEAEGTDGYDTIEWLAAQPWCTGRIGTMGAFYESWAQWAAAAERPPHLKAIVSTSAIGGRAADVPARNGLIKLGMLAWLHAVGGRVWQDGSQVDWNRVMRHLPLRTMDRALGRELPAWHEWLDHATEDDGVSTTWSPDAFARIDVPALHITGWYDDCQDGTLFIYDGMVAHSPAAERQCLLVGPWDRRGAQTPRQVVGGVDFGGDAALDLKQVHLQWFQNWLLEDAPRTQSPVARSQYFVTGGAGAWRSDDEKITSRSSVTFHLSGGDQEVSAAQGHLQLELGTGAPTSYRYDPHDPVLVATDAVFFPNPPVAPVEAPLDRRFMERRDDVVTFTSAELTDPLEVVGRPRVRLFAGSDCPDTDWIVQLTDVSPSGASTFVADGVMRARHRDGLNRESFMRPDEHYEFSIALSLVAHRFEVGHRVRLLVTSSLFPIHDRNLNTGGPVDGDAEPRVATNRVFHDAARPSHVTLPVRDVSDGRESA